MGVESSATATLDSPRHLRYLIRHDDVRELQRLNQLRRHSGPPCRSLQDILRAAAVTWRTLAGTRSLRRFHAAAWQCQHGVVQCDGHWKLPAKLCRGVQWRARRSEEAFHLQLISRADFTPGTVGSVLQTSGSSACRIRVDIYPHVAAANLTNT